MKLKKLTNGFLIDPPLEEYDLNDSDFRTLGFYKNTRELILGFQFQPSKRKEFYIALQEMIKNRHNTAVFGELYGDFMYTKKE